MNQHLGTHRGRFVLLRHEVPKNAISGKLSAVGSSSDSIAPEDHFDLLLETDIDRLLTWRIPLDPMPFCDHQPEAVETSALRIQDHRVNYLEYEGPVSNDRGTVTQVLKGIYSTKAEDPSCRESEICSDRLIGPLKLIDFERQAASRSPGLSSILIQSNRRRWLLKVKPTPIGTLTVLISKSMSLLAGVQMAD